MNMKEAKVQLKQTIQAYLARDAFGNLAIPQVAQRPLLLMGPPGIGKTAIAHQAAARVRRRPRGLHHDPPHPPERHWPAQHPDWRAYDGKEY